MHVRPYIKVFSSYVKGGERGEEENNIYMYRRIKEQFDSKILEKCIEILCVSSYNIINTIIFLFPFVYVLCGA